MTGPGKKHRFRNALAVLTGAAAPLIGLTAVVEPAAHATTVQLGQSCSSTSAGTEVPIDPYGGQLGCQPDSSSPSGYAWLALNSDGCATMAPAPLVVTDDDGTYQTFWVDAGGQLTPEPNSAPPAQQIVAGWVTLEDCSGTILDGNTWVVTPQGVVYTLNFGFAPQANNYGDTANVTLNKPILAMAMTPDSGGYWLFAADGGTFTFGDASFYGSLGNIVLNKPITAAASTPDGRGYWLAANDGGIFTFGDAQFFGSLGNITLNKPVEGMTPTPDGGGYWMVASDGGIFAFGDAPFLGSLGNRTLTAPIAGMIPDGSGYTLVGQDGQVYPFS